MPRKKKEAAPGCQIDTAAIDDAILALLFLSLDRDGRAWKGFDWDAMNRLHDRGMIGNPVSKAKSVVLTDEGIARSQALFEQLFTKRPETPEV